MRVTDYIKKQTGRIPISIEILPPVKGTTWDEIRQAVSRLASYGIAFTSVTSHARETTVEVVEGEPVVRTRRKRVDTNAICLALKKELGVEVMPHVICEGATKDETEDALLTLHFFGVDNILALRGDLHPGHLPFQLSQLKNSYAADLVEQIARMNEGVYLDPSAGYPKTNFCIGVAGYPEKHHESPDVKTDLKFLREKVDQGASFIITQMFFDNDAYYRFTEACHRIGITVPIIPGIKPVYKASHITRLPEIFHVKAPKPLLALAEKYSDENDLRQAGIEYTVRQTLDLLRNGAPGLHFYTMSSVDPTDKILEAIVTKDSLLPSFPLRDDFSSARFTIDDTQSFKISVQ